MSAINLRVSVVVLLAAAASGMGPIGCNHPASTTQPADSREDDKTAEDQKRLEGAWIMMTEEDQGRELPADKLQERFRLVIEGSKWTLKENNGPEKKEWDVRTDSAKSPKQADFTYLFGENKGRVSHGIYELKGDSLRACIAEPGESRPTEFDGKGKKTLILFQRVK
jgi:uncharacterized protein (TIGR03067 family)